jgi:S-adenosylmethionine:tRNA ribosyltransferase-isomerase
MDRLAEYDYDLPKERIATSPAEPRDSAKLLVYDTASDKVTIATVRNLPEILSSEHHLVFNDTKVVPARVHLTKPTGGTIEVLLYMNLWRPDEEVVRGIVDRKLEVGTPLRFKQGATLTAIAQEENVFVFQPSVSVPKLFPLLESEGETPIPPYIKNTPLSEETLRERYQSVFATHPASVAAPTASLHFTPKVLDNLQSRGIGASFVTLHVGAGTFAPINDENFQTKRLFRERIHVGEEAAAELNAAIRSGKTILPVGTTALRTIESTTRPKNPDSHRTRVTLERSVQGLPLYEISSCNKETDLFIFPPYDFRIAGALMTNFHVPRSSLMLLVEVLLRHKRARRRLLDLYRIALEEQFRFYSFGDAMLVL